MCVPDTGLRHLQKTSDKEQLLDARNPKVNTMEIINFSEVNSIINQYLAEMRDVEYQKNRLLFRNNIQRIGEYEAFEIS